MRRESSLLNHDDFEIRSVVRHLHIEQ